MDDVDIDETNESEELQAGADDKIDDEENNDWTGAELTLGFYHNPALTKMMTTRRGMMMVKTRLAMKRTMTGQAGAGLTPGQ